MAPNINLAIIRSIPLDRDLKRYFVSKWNHLCLHNGERYASDVFAEVKTVLLSYRADPHRIQHREKYLTALPIRKNGWARRILQYMDTHPSAVLNFFKLYTGFAKPLVTVEEAAEQQELYLATRADVINTDVPWFMEAWLSHFVDGEMLSYHEFRALAWLERIHQLEEQGIDPFATNTTMMLRWEQVNQWRVSRIPREVRRLLKSYIRWKGHSYGAYKRYYRQWNSILKRRHMSEREADEAIRSKPVLPQIYKDFILSGDGPASALGHEDLIEASWLWHYATDWWKPNGSIDKPSVSKDSLKLLSSVFNQNWRFPQFNGTVTPLENSIYYNDMKYYTVSHGRHSHVGHVHYIPKKGTIKRRPIAVPNRFLQQCLVPVYQHLAEYVSRLPRDCTFDQSRLDYKIQNRVNNENLFVGSVDLSQATDNLPLSWGIRIMESLIHDTDVSLHRSRNLFVEMSRSSWVSTLKTRVSWTVGQPLGTLPSFMTLALTHNLYLESMAFSLGISHSPYTVLGDDVVIFNKKLRRTYIRDLTNRGLPLSLHKSFVGNLTEFAGKTYVKNMKPFYTSDHSAVSYESLFDYSRATGMSIPWDNLPKYLRRRIERRCHSALSAYSEGLTVSSVYNAVQTLYIPPRGSFSIRMDTSLKEIFDVFVESQDRLDPELDPTLDLRWFAGHPIQLGKTSYIEKHGHMLRIKSLELEPDWFKRKFRPVSTDRLLTAGAMALMELKHQYEMGHISVDYERAYRSMWSRILG